MKLGRRRNCPSQEVYKAGGGGLLQLQEPLEVNLVVAVYKVLLLDSHVQGAHARQEHREAENLLNS